MGQLSTKSLYLQLFTLSFFMGVFICFSLLISLFFDLHCIRLLYLALSSSKKLSQLFSILLNFLQMSPIVSLLAISLAISSSFLVYLASHSFSLFFINPSLLLSSPLYHFFFPFLPLSSFVFLFLPLL